MNADPLVQRRLRIRVDIEQSDDETPGVLALLGRWRPSFIACAALLMLSLLTRWVAAETVPAQERSLVRLRALGSVTEGRLSNLRALIEADLAGTGVTLVLEQGGGSMRQWVTQVQRDERAVVIAVLDTRQSDQWQITIIDPARRRAIRRRLPGGVAEDAAALEAVASIVVSAVTALKDGLEVASQPVEQVLLDSGESSSAGISEGTTTTSVEVFEQESEPALVVPRAALLASVVSFAEDKPSTVGFGAALGLTLLSRLTLRLMGLRFREAVFDTAFGEFGSVRNIVGAALGPHFDGGEWQLELEARFVAELLERGRAAPAEGVVALDEALLTRYGGGIGVRGRYLPLANVGVELTLGGGYMPRRVKFVTTPNSYEMAELWPWFVSAELGFEVSLH